MNTINDKQIELMKHCIGMRRDRIKNYKYKAFRNYFTTSIIHPEWEDLVNKGCATSRKNESHYCDNGRVYFVTRKGFDLLEKLTLIKIVELD